MTSMISNRGHIIMSYRQTTTKNDIVYATCSNTLMSLSINLYDIRNSMSFSAVPGGAHSKSGIPHGLPTLDRSKNVKHYKVYVKFIFKL